MPVVTGMLLEVSALNYLDDPKKIGTNIKIEHLQKSLLLGSVWALCRILKAWSMNKYHLSLPAVDSWHSKISWAFSSDNNNTNERTRRRIIQQRTTRSITCNYNKSYWKTLVILAEERNTKRKRQKTIYWQRKTKLWPRTGGSTLGMRKYFRCAISVVVWMKPLSMSRTIALNLFQVTTSCGDMTR